MKSYSPVAKRSSSKARILSLTNPSGREELAYLDSKAAGITSFGEYSYDNYLVPMRPDILPEVGTWTYTISGANDVRLTLREDPSASEEATLVLQPYLTTTTPRNFETIVDVFKVGHVTALALDRTPSRFLYLFDSGK